MAEINIETGTVEQQATTAAPEATADTEAKQTDTKPEAQTYTIEQVQSEIDRRVTQALQKQRKEYEKKLSLSQLGDQERAAAEKDQTIADLQEQLAELHSYKAKAEMIGELSKAGLPTAFADVIAIDADNPEQNLARVKALGEAFKAAVEETVKQRLAGKAPVAGTAPAGVTKEQFRKMTLAQQAELAHTDPENYKKLTE